MYEVFISFIECYNKTARYYLVQIKEVPSAFAGIMDEYPYLFDAGKRDALCKGGWEI